MNIKDRRIRGGRRVGRDRLLHIDGIEGQVEEGGRRGGRDSRFPYRRVGDITSDKTCIDFALRQSLPHFLFCVLGRLTRVFITRPQIVFYLRVYFQPRMFFFSSFFFSFSLHVYTRT